jgi:hypothetical protein
VGLKKGLFSAFGGLGCVLDRAMGFEWLLGGFLGERGGEGHPPLFFSNRVDGGVTPPFRSQFFY